MKAQHYTIKLSWESKEAMESNLTWMLRHFRHFKHELHFCRTGSSVKFNTGHSSIYRNLRRLAAQCGATVLEKTIGGIDTRMVKVTIQ